MIRIDKDEIISELNLTNFGSQGWLQDKNGNCPFCGKPKKWGIHFNEVGNSLVFHCWRCNTKTSTFNLLKQIGRLDLIRSTYENSVKSNYVELVPDNKDQKEVKDLELKKISLPLRLKNINQDPYLDQRGFKKYHYEEFEPSYTDSFLEKSLKNYIIFKIKMDHNIVAWLARSRYSKEWHENNLKESKKRGIKPQLRYENSRTDFTKILGGYDNINENTESVIIVEGLFDYIGVDNKLNLHESDFLKCVFTFGNSISTEQINLLIRKGIHNVILMYDPDKPDQIKSAGLILQRFFNTKIALLRNNKIDPGDASVDELLNSLENLIDPINFRVLKSFSI